MTSFPSAVLAEVFLSSQLSHCIPCCLKHGLSVETQLPHGGGTFDGGQGVPWKDRL